MKQRHQFLLVAAVSLAMVGGGIVLVHADADEEAPSGPVTPGLARTAPSITSLGAPQKKSPGAQPVVRASRFELADNEGNTRGVLGLSAAEEPSLALASRSGQIYARLMIEPVPSDLEGIPVMQLLDKAGTVRTDIRLTRDGDPQVVLKNPQGKHVASLSGNAIHRGGTEWLLSDDNGHVRVMLAINHAGTNLIFLDEGKKIRSRLSLDQNGTPNLVFSDEAGRQKTVAGFDAIPSGAAATGASAKQR
jgi:hypothetical protein